jgi:hypothetical protein
MNFEKLVKVVETFPITAYVFSGGIWICHDDPVSHVALVKNTSIPT